MKLLVGCDPELWIFDNKLGKIISAYGLFPGTKESPHPVTHGAVQVDGMAAEYNINPASSPTEFVRNNISVLCDLRDLIKERNPDLDFKFVFTPVAEFGTEYIDAQPMEAKQLGCTPDFNAWEGGAINPIPDAEQPFRTTSGHVHLGWTKDQDINDPEFTEACCMIVKQLDCALGNRIVHWEEGTDGTKRRELYGKAGAYRPKSYGVEYRTPSDVWLTNTVRMQTIFNSINVAFNDLLAGGRYYETPSYDDICERINSGREYMFTKKMYEYDENSVTMANLDRLRRKWDGEMRYVINDDGDRFDGFDPLVFDEGDDEDDFLPDDVGDDFEPQPVAVPAPWGLINAAAGIQPGAINDIVFDIEADNNIV